MKRYLKTLGLALGAMLALGALLAAGASAQGERFHSTEKNVILTGHSSNPTLRIGDTESSRTVTCETGTYQATITGEEQVGETWTSKEVTVHPIYDEPCESFVGEATVHTDGCDFILTSEYKFKETEGGHKDEHAPVEVECTSGHTITIVATGCTITIGGGFYEGHPEEEGNNHGDVTEDTLTTGVTYENLGKGHPETTVTVTATVDDIPYTSHGFLCGFAGIPKEGHDGYYEDDVVVEAREDIEPCTLDETTHVLTNCGEGEETAIWWE